MDIDANGPVTNAALKAELAQLRADIRADIQAESQQLKEYIDERTFDAETRVLYSPVT